MSDPGIEVGHPLEYMVQDMKRGHVAETSFLVSLPGFEKKKN